MMCESGRGFAGKGEGDFGGWWAAAGSANVQRRWPSADTLGSWDDGLRRCPAKT